MAKNLKLYLLLLASGAGSFIFYIQGAKLEEKDEQLCKAGTIGLEKELKYKDSLIKNMTKQMNLLYELSKLRLDSFNKHKAIYQNNPSRNPQISGTKFPDTIYINMGKFPEKNYDDNFRKLENEMGYLRDKMENLPRNYRDLFLEQTIKEESKNHINDKLGNICSAAIDFGSSTKNIDSQNDPFLIKLRIIILEIRNDLKQYDTQRGNGLTIVKRADELYSFIKDSTKHLNRQQLVGRLEVLCGDRLD